MADSENRELQEENKRLWDLLIKLRASKVRVEEERTQLHIGTSHLRLAHAGLEAEVARLRSQLSCAKAEAGIIGAQSTDLRRKNEELQALARRNAEEMGVLKDRIAELMERIPNPVSIPLEVITIIADFLAGSSSFGTLFNLSLANKEVRQGCLSTCYETIITVDTDAWMRAFKKARDGTAPAEWKHCKYVFLPTWWYRFKPIGHFFPNVRLAFTRGFMDGPERNFHGGRLQSHNSQIVIHQPVSVALFFKLLQTPQRWRDRYDARAEPEVLAGSRAVDFIIVEERGALIHSSEEAVDIVQTENTVDTLCIHWRADTTPDETRNTFRALANLAPNARNEATPQDYPAVKFQIEAGPAVDAWIDALSFMTARQPRATISLELKGDVRFVAFKKYMLSVGKEYSRAWRVIEDRMTGFGEENVTFFSMTHKYVVSGETVDIGRKWEGWIFMHPGHTPAKPFTVAIMECLDSDDEKERRVIFQKLFAVPKKRNPVPGFP